MAKRTNFECYIAICSGDYESALVLYHRAANLYPRDSSHGVAARRTAATISSCNNPSKALRKVLPSSGERLTAALCPETAAIMANEQLKKSPEPMSIPEVLRYVTKFITEYVEKFRSWEKCYWIFCSKIELKKILTFYFFHGNFYFAKTTILYDCLSRQAFRNENSNMFD